MGSVTVLPDTNIWSYVVAADAVQTIRKAAKTAGVDLEGFRRRSRLDPVKFRVVGSASCAVAMVSGGEAGEVGEFVEGGVVGADRGSQAR